MLLLAAVVILAHQTFGLIYLQSGVPYHATLNYNQTILFGYNVTDPCADFRIVSTGNPDLWVSHEESFPHVYGYDVYSFTCEGDVIDVHSSDYYFTTGTWVISLYLDQLIYSGPENATITVTETRAPNTIVAAATTINGLAYGDAEDLHQTIPNRICVSDAKAGISITPEVFGDVDVEGFQLILRRASFVEHRLQNDILDLDDIYFTPEDQFNLNLQNGTSVSVTSANYKGFKDGNYWLYITPTCQDGVCDWESTQWSVDVNTEADVSPPIRPQVSSASFGTSITFTLFQGETKYFNFSNSLEACDDVKITFGNLMPQQMSVYAAHFPYPDSSTFHWSFDAQKSTPPPQILIPHDEFEALGLSSLYITFQCESLKGCDGGPMTVSFQAVQASNTLISTYQFSATEWAYSNTINWHSVCIPSANVGLNITSTTLNITSTGVYNVDEGGQLVDVLISKVPYFERNYTRYIGSATPNANLWANWEYDTNKYPGCRSSYFINSDTTFFRPGDFYIGFYSFCLPSCGYCNPAIYYTASMKRITGDLEVCETWPSNSTETQITTSTTTYAQDSGSGRLSVATLALFIVLVLC
eukprot:TRINITY_DN2478_c0_g1_i2.p1 TRINITY_DN2478_c0_g1~~TRINITY_DN2478_c0_g1_i2.p1  ORF type:complete len:586 (-),score=51.26 TRINITY_DN2478_c0_g1_i2:12-1769(-)